MNIARKLPTVDMSKAEFIWNKASVDKSILYFRDAHIFKPKKVQITNNRRPEIPVWERSSLTIDQAAVYCGVGKDKRYRKMNTLNHIAPNTTNLL